MTQAIFAHDRLGVDRFAIQDSRAEDRPTLDYEHEYRCAEHEHAGAPRRSNPLELPIQFLTRENQRRRPAVGTMVGVVDQVPLLQ